MNMFFTLRSGVPLLDERKLKDQGRLDPVPVRRLWDEHVSAQRRWHYYLWDVLMFQSWLEAQGRGVGMTRDAEHALVGAAG